MLEERQHDRPRYAAELADALPGLTRIAASAAWHTTGWALNGYFQLGGRMARAAISRHEAAALAEDTRRMVTLILRELLDVLDRRDGERDLPDWEEDNAVPSDRDGNRNRPGRSGSSPAQADTAGKAALVARQDGRSMTLRERGQLLLELSRDVNYEHESHPAYERILTELAPDEARILLLLLLEGPQPSVDVRTGGPVGMVKSRLIAPGLTMIGARAGCRYVERVPSYLNNLFRLGLIWFSRETLGDSMRYQLLEAQPDVLDAIHSVGHAKVVRRSIHLTPFGEDFCRTCLAPEAMQLEELPEHSLPPSVLEGAEPAEG